MTRRLPKLWKPIAVALSLTALVMILPLPNANAADYSDEQLKSFVTAWDGINQLAEQWKPQVEAAASAEQASDMLQQFEVEANQVIEDVQGIETAEYEGIIKAAQADPALKERILTMLQDIQKK